MADLTKPDVCPECGHSIFIILADAPFKKPDPVNGRRRCCGCKTEWRPGQPMPKKGKQ